MSFLLKSAFWLSLMFFVLKIDVGDGRHAERAAAPQSLRTQMMQALDSVGREGKNLAADVAVSCVTSSKSCNEVMLDKARAGVGMAEATPRSRDTLTTADLLPHWQGGSAPREDVAAPAASAMPRTPLTHAPVPQRRPS